MSVAVLPSYSSAPPAFCSENYLCWAPPEEQCKVTDHPPFPAVENNEEEEEDRPGQFDVWNAIQSKKPNSETADPPTPYVHPLLRRSPSLLSQNSLEVCTESLGSETGSDDFSSSVDHQNSENTTEAESQEEQIAEEDDDPIDGDVHPREPTSVNYHCCISRRSPPRSFPPPLPSISRRDGPCLHMRPHRRGGRLVVEAVPVPSQNYLHAQREGGRLLLSFVDATSDEPPSCFTVEKHSDAIDVPEEIEEEEEEEVEVVDRGTVVEVKVSTQPQQQSSAAKVLRSSVVINKFVGDTPVAPSSAPATAAEPEHPAETDDYYKTTHIAYSGAPLASTVAPPRRAASTTTAASVVAASTLGVDGSSDYYYSGRHYQPYDNKLLFTSKRRNREELLHHMRRCSQLRRPLFIWEPYCIATS